MSYSRRKFLKTGITSALAAPVIITSFSEFAKADNKVITPKISGNPGFFEPNIFDGNTMCSGYPYEIPDMNDQRPDSDLHNPDFEIM
ncbi:hypothetical protein ACFL7D_09390 [candidate division KSB1 bacterium]